MKKRLLSLVLILCMMISLSVVPVSAASPKVYDKMSDSYKSGPYYTKLMNVNLTGNQIDDLINVARSQVGYHAGSSKTDLSGTSKTSKNYVEYFNLISPKTQGNAWCATFVTWCFREAGIPTSIMPSATGCGKVRNSVKNQGATYHTRESGYKPKRGDIILYESMGGNYSYYQVASRDANGLPSSTSHVGIVSKDYNESTKKFTTIQRSGAVVKEFEESINTKGKDKDGNKTIYRIQGFVTPAYKGSTKPSGMLTMYFNANGGTLDSDTYAQNSSGMIQKNGTNVTVKWAYGQGSPEYGLWNASSFGLARSGYKFLGWSLSKDGRSQIIDQDDTSITSDKIYPNLKNGDATVTMYAVWAAADPSENAVLTMYYNVNGGVIDSDTYSQSAGGRIQKDGADVTAKWKYGTGNTDYGLSNASTFGLSRDGYDFLGWSLTGDDSSQLLGQDDLTLTAEKIYPDLGKGSASVTLYAVWEENMVEADPDEITEGEMGPDTEMDVEAEDESTEPESTEPEPAEPEPSEPEQTEPEPVPETPAKNTIVMKIDDPLMIVNGKVTPVDERGNTPVIRNQRTMLPIASVMLAMDGTVAWDGETKTVTLKRKGKTMFLRIGTSFAWDENGLAVAQLDSPPVIINGRTMLPVAAVVLYFGADISWEGTTRTVTITYE